MAEQKRGSSRAKKGPVKVEFEPIAEMVPDDDPRNILIEGLQFSWQNSDTNSRRGWRHWRPVMRDTELGAKVAEMFEVTGHQYIGNNTDTNMFYKGPDTVLAYTETRLQEKADTLESEKARKEIQLLMDDPTVEYNRRQVVINMGDPTGEKNRKA